MMVDNFANPTKVAAFLAKWRAVPDTDCLVWSRSCNQQGQPQVGWQGTTMLSRRVAWQIANGAEPTGVEVYSTCGHSLCGNPTHLTVGTRTERHARGKALRHEGEKAELPIPSRASRASVSLTDRATIIAMDVGKWKRGGITRAVIADTFDISKGGVSRIWREARRKDHEAGIVAAFLMADTARSRGASIRQPRRPRDWD
jgi:hypothetical protein